MADAFEQRGDQVQLVSIEGAQLSAVTFVQDYVQLHFDGPKITAITWPFIVSNGIRSDFGTPGYRDRLCGLIGRQVTNAYLRPGERLEVDFGDDSSVIVPLDPDAYPTAEAAIVDDGKSGQWAVG